MKKYLILVLYGLLCLNLVACWNSERVVKTHSNGVPQIKLTLNSDQQVVFKQTWWSNGGTDEIIPYKDGLMDGVYESWDITGALLEKGSYEKGLKEGRWTTWHKRDKRASSGEYLHGKKEGLWQYWYLSGNLKSQENWKSGVLVQDIVSWHDGSQKEIQNSCLPTNPSGRYTQWSENGVKILEYTCLREKPDGLWQRFDALGKQIERRSYKNGLPDGEWLNSTSDQKPLVVRHYVNGLLEGKQVNLSVDGDTIQTAYFEKGTGRLFEYCPDKIYVCRDSSWSEGRLVGVLRSWDGSRLVTEDSLISDGADEKGQKLSSRKIYKLVAIKNKAQLLLLQKGMLKNDQKEGSWITYSQGQILRDEFFFKGKPLGLQKTFVVQKNQSKLIRKENYAFPGGGLTVQQFGLN
jgi:antitoxin component YwqK of YwqJK toxin-antitoxin module